MRNRRDKSFGGYLRIEVEKVQDWYKHTFSSQMTAYDMENEKENNPKF